MITDLDTREFHTVHPTFSPKQPSTYVFLPKRNIETWIHWLNRQQADEATDYSLRYKQDPSKLIHQAIAHFDRFVCGQLPIEADTLASLTKAIEEAQLLYRNEV